LAATAAVIFFVLTRDPTEPLAVAAVIGASAVAAACTVAFLGVAVEERDAALARPRRRHPRRAAAVRRGAEIGAIVMSLGLLRAVDGLTLITAGFVVAGFILAELVLSARPAARSG
jgi:hypothetical protein